MFFIYLFLCVFVFLCLCHGKSVEVRGPLGTVIFFPYQAGPEDWTQDVRFGHSLYSLSHDFSNNWRDFMKYFRFYLLCSECFNHDLAKHLTNNQEIVADSAQWTILLCNALASSTPILQPNISSQRWAVSPNKNRNLIKTCFLLCFWSLGSYIAIYQIAQAETQRSGCLCPRTGGATTAADILISSNPFPSFLICGHHLIQESKIFGVLCYPLRSHNLYGVARKTVVKFETGHIHPWVSHSIPSHPG